MHNFNDKWGQDMWDEDAKNNQEIEKQKNLTDAWTYVSSKPDLRPAEAVELELQRRISACTEEDTTEKRTQERIKLFKAEEKLEEWRRGQVGGEHEEDMVKEMTGQQEKYKAAWERAKKSVGLE